MLLPRKEKTKITSSWFPDSNYNSGGYGLSLPHSDAGIWLRQETFLPNWVGRMAHQPEREGGEVGAAFVWWQSGDWKGEGTFLGRNKEAFDAEVFAILGVVRHLNETGEQPGVHRCLRFPSGHL